MKCQILTRLLLQGSQKKVSKYEDLSLNRNRIKNRQRDQIFRQFRV